MVVDRSPTCSTSPSMPSTMMKWPMANGRVVTIITVPKMFFHGVFPRQGDGHAADTQGGQDPGGVLPEDGGDLKKARDHDDDADDLPGDQDHGSLCL